MIEGGSAQQAIDEVAFVALHAHDGRSVSFVIPMGRVELPDGLALQCHLEHVAGVRVGDERVAVRQSLAAAACSTPAP